MGSTILQAEDTAINKQENPVLSWSSHSHVDKQYTQNKKYRRMQNAISATEKLRGQYQDK